MIGTVSRVFYDRGFLFIAGEAGERIFMHATGLVDGIFDDLATDDRVTFDVEQTPKGPRAVNVRVTTPTTPSAGDETNAPNPAERVVFGRGAGC